MASATRIGAKTAGLAKQAMTALQGYPAIYHHLAGEHAEVAALMRRVNNAGEDMAARNELFPEIRKNLLGHARAEEAEFYAPLRRFPEVRELVEKCTEEHHEVEAYLDELNSSDKTTKMWRDLFERMMEAVEKHVAREENDLFPKARDLLTTEQAREIEGRYERTEEQAKAQL